MPPGMLLSLAPWGAAPPDSPPWSIAFFSHATCDAPHMPPGILLSQTMPWNVPLSHLSVQAHNGSGKTTCFVLSMLSRSVWGGASCDMQLGRLVWGGASRDMSRVRTTKVKRGVLQSSFMIYG